MNERFIRLPHQMTRCTTSCELRTFACVVECKPFLDIFGHPAVERPVFAAEEIDVPNRVAHVRREAPKELFLFSDRNEIIHKTKTNCKWCNLSL